MAKKSKKSKKSSKSAKNSGMYGLLKVVANTPLKYEGEITEISDGRIIMRARKPGSRKHSLTTLPITNVIAIQAASGSSLNDLVGQEAIVVTKPTFGEVVVGKKKTKTKYTMSFADGFVVGEADNETVLFVSEEFADVEAEDEEGKKAKKGKKDKKGKKGKKSDVIS